MKPNYLDAYELCSTLATGATELAISSHNEVRLAGERYNIFMQYPQLNPAAEYSAEEKVIYIYSKHVDANMMSI